MLVGMGLETINIGFHTPNSFSDLSQKEWCYIREMADKQGVSSIVLDGLNLLVNTYGKSSIAPQIENAWWQQFVLDWAGMMSMIELSNSRQMTVMNAMASRWSESGCKVMVFKGQASAVMYPKPEHRSPGDIDCYLFDNYAKGNDIARAIGASVDESWYKHSVISFKGETFENHQYFVLTRNGKRSKKLEQELEDELANNETGVIEWGKLSEHVILPPIQWYAMFLTYHSCGHFLTEGLRLKQVLDWAMLLEKHQEEIDWPRYYAFCDKYHLRKFTEAVTAICTKYIGVKIRIGQIETESPLAEKILDSALYDEDYVFASGEGAWHNRFHLIKNLFRYRWKYNDVYDQSVLRQLWYDVIGFLVHTE